MAIPRPAEAGLLSSIASGLGIISSGLKLFGASHANAAASLAQEAQFELLTGIARGVEELLEAQVTILKLLASMDEVVQRVIAEMQIKNRKMEVLVLYQLFLDEQSAMIKNHGGRGEVEELVTAYENKVSSWLETVRTQADLFTHSDEAQKNPITVALFALCVKIENDMIIELLSMGNISGILPERMKRQIEWFNATLDPELDGGLHAQIVGLRAEISDQQAALMAKLSATPDGSFGYVAHSSLTYEGYTEDAFEFIEVDDPPNIYFSPHDRNPPDVMVGPNVRVKIRSLTAPTFKRVQFKRQTDAPAQDTLDFDVQNAPIFTLSKFSNAHEYIDDMSAEDLKGLSQRSQGPEFTLEQAQAAVNDTRGLIYRLSAFEKTIEIASLARDLCNRTMLTEV